MKSTPLIIRVILTILAFSKICVAEPNLENAASKLEFDSVEVLSTTKKAMRARFYPADNWSKMIQAEGLANIVEERIKIILPEIRESLKNNEGNCALVEIIVDSSPRPDGTKNYRLRDISTLGVGNTAVQVLGMNIVKGRMTSAPKDGFTYDSEVSLLICFGYSGEALMANPIAMIDVQDQVIAKAKEIHEKELQMLRNAQSKAPAPTPKKSHKNTNNGDPLFQREKILPHERVPRAPEPRAPEPRAPEPRAPEPRAPEPRAPIPAPSRP